MMKNAKSLLLIVSLVMMTLSCSNKKTEKSEASADSGPRKIATETEKSSP
jgi:hypothetical protein